MYKVTSKGITEFGSIIKLSAEDLATIMLDIGAKTASPNLRKVNGKWIQGNTINLEGYRVFNGEAGE